MFACGESPTATGDEEEFIGSWLHIESDDYAKLRMEFGKSGKFLISVELGGETLSWIGTWSITADVLTLKMQIKVYLYCHQERLDNLLNQMYLDNQFHHQILYFAT